MFQRVLIFLGEGRSTIEFVMIFMRGWLFIIFIDISLIVMALVRILLSLLLQ